MSDMSTSADQPSAEPTISERGFAHGDPVPSTYGGFAKAYVSSAAMHPHIWLSVTCPVDLNERAGPMKEAVAHLRIEHARVLRDQLTNLIDGHYQEEPASSPR